jgi:hypothetical protein
MKKFLVILIVASGCMVGNDSNSGALFTGGRCEGAPAAYADCVADVGADRDTCYGDCLDDMTKCAVDTAVNLVTNSLPCAGPILESLLTSCAFCVKESGNDLLACATSCVAGIYDEYFRDFAKFKTTFAACAGNIDDAALDLIRHNGYEAMLEALASGAGCVLAYNVCTSIDNVGGVQLGSCDTQYVAGLDGCDTASCNPAYCTCFDAPECPTIGGGAATTHMAGVVSCDSIIGGKGTTAQGTEVSCISYTNNAEPETCTETGWNPDGSFGNRGRFEACDSDAHCGTEGDQALSCLDYDCDGRRHCDFSDLGGPGNCCEINGPKDAGCKDGFTCEYNEDRDRMMCEQEEQQPGTGSGG